MVPSLTNSPLWKSVALSALSWKLNCGPTNSPNITVNMVCTSNPATRNPCSGSWGLMALPTTIKWCWAASEYKSVLSKFSDNRDMFKPNASIGWPMRLLSIRVLIPEDGVATHAISPLASTNTNDEKPRCMPINDRACALNQSTWFGSKVGQFRIRLCSAWIRSLEKTSRLIFTCSATDCALEIRAARSSFWIKTPAETNKKVRKRNKTVGKA